eukprot:4623572-Prorocentrum_lima.AAC.1
MKCKGASHPASLLAGNAPYASWLSGLHRNSFLALGTCLIGHLSAARLTEARHQNRSTAFTRDGLGDGVVLR